MKRTLAVIAALAIPASAVVMAPAASAGDVTPIVIAVEAPLSGPQGSNGRDILRGARLAADQINTLLGGINGRPVVIAPIDDQANPDLADDAVAQAQAAGAVAVVGPYNSSVGVINLPMYIAAGIVPVQMTSTDLTNGMGVTVQPKNSQISPVELDYAAGLNAQRVVMLVDPSTYTRGMANRFKRGIRQAGGHVSTITITEGKASYATEVALALSKRPDLIYVSTYFPEGAKIADALSTPRTKRNLVPCLMGMGNVDQGMITDAGVTAAMRCVYSGVPEPTQLSGDQVSMYISGYRSMFHKRPGVWGAYAFDSVVMAAAAMSSTGSTDYAKVLNYLRHVEGAEGVTGRITINPVTGNRHYVPVSILHVWPNGTFRVEAPAPI